MLSESTRLRLCRGCEMSRGPSYHISWEGTVAFCLSSLANILATEACRGFGRGQGGKRFTGIHESRRRDGFDSCSPAYVRPNIVGSFQDRVKASVHRSGMQANAQVQRLWQAHLNPVRGVNHLAELKCKHAGIPYCSEDEIETVSPSILEDRQVGSTLQESRDASKKTSYENWNLVLL